VFKGDVLKKRFRLNNDDKLVEITKDTVGHTIRLLFYFSLKISLKNNGSSVVINLALG
jgi:hypothetical protein